MKSKHTSILTKRQVALANNRQIVKLATIVFSMYKFHLKDLQEIIDQIERLQMKPFTDYMGAAKSDYPQHQKDFLRNVLRGRKENRRRVFNYDKIAGEWIHLPGLLWLGTREKNPVFTRAQLLQRIDGIEGPHKQNKAGADVKITGFDKLKKEIADGKVFDRPSMVQLDLFLEQEA